MSYEFLLPVFGTFSGIQSKRFVSGKSLGSGFERGQILGCTVGHAAKGPINFVHLQFHRSWILPCYLACDCDVLLVPELIFG